MKYIVIILLFPFFLSAQCAENFSLAFDVEENNDNGTSLYSFNAGWEYSGSPLGQATLDIIDPDDNTIILGSFNAQAFNDEFEFFLVLETNQTFCYRFFIVDSGVECFDTGIVCQMLPVDLIRWTATKQGDYALLEWVTAAEENNKGFDVYHSTDGDNWERVGRARGSGTTEIQTVYHQRYKLQEGDNYYKLRQVDFNGRETWYKALHVLNQKKTIKLFPMVVRENLNLSVSPEFVGSAAQIYSHIGELVLNTEITEGTAILNVQSLPSGLYIVLVGRKTMKFIKQ